ncbi:hypothetical protein EDC04DRAFT_2611010 [Pisolithus marmoratus]|nr:hypothetical protein EDC04DRAFT_2611010 [Pisolithus marmoratus]
MCQLTKLLITFPLHAVLTVASQHALPRCFPSTTNQQGKLRVIWNHWDTKVKLTVVVIIGCITPCWAIGRTDMNIHNRLLNTLALGHHWRWPQSPLLIMKVLANHFINVVLNIVLASFAHMKLRK